MTSKARQRQLKKLAQRRAADRRRHRRNRIIAGTVAALMVLGAGGGLAYALIFRDEGQPPEAGKEPMDMRSPEVETVACGGSKPASAGQEKPTFQRPPKPALKDGVDYRGVIETSCGTVELDLYERETPVTVNNFVFLARERFFDGLIFHRVVPDFVIQGGDPQGSGAGGPGYEFENEEVKGLDFDRPGLVGMANSGPDTNGSQFFITVAPAPNLNQGYTLFGEVTKGMDVVRRINGLPTDAQEAPVETVYMERVRIEER
jgi:cyclophilin family peptidyl-prolyl cis-trans isomerase